MTRWCWRSTDPPAEAFPGRSRWLWRRVYAAVCFICLSESRWCASARRRLLAFTFTFTVRAGFRAHILYTDDDDGIGWNVSSQLRHVHEITHHAPLARWRTAALNRSSMEMPACQFTSINSESAPCDQNHMGPALWSSNGIKSGSELHFNCLLVCHVCAEF